MTQGKGQEGPENLITNIIQSTELKSVINNLFVSGTAATTGSEFHSEDFIYVFIDMELRFLKAEEYPVLAKLWDNDDDAIFDSL